MWQFRRSLFLCALAAAPVCAQNAEITGTVNDSTGAVVPGATVTATNTATNAARSIVTNAAGNYSVPFLAPGVYNVQAEQKGFRTATRTGVQLQVGDAARINFTMELGDVTEAIEVVGTGVLLATEGTGVGTVIENRRIVELPLNGRNYLQLIALSPTVTAETQSSFTAAGRQGGERASQNYSITGQRLQYTHYTLDGIENTDPNWNLFVFRPSIDALQEFKVESGVYSAEYGRNPGQVNVTTKSGANEYHGTIYEFLRNDKLDARQWLQSTGSKNPFRRNQYGFTLGGPISLPKVFSGKNRLFFMSNFEGLRDNKTLQEVASVATDKMRLGDFSAAGRNIFDPLSRTFRSDANGNQLAVSATQFPGNVIPPNQISPIAKKLLEFYPAPTAPGDNINRNYIRQASRPIQWDQFTQRVDFNENSQSFWFGRFGWDDEFTATDSTFPNQEERYTTKAYQAMISNTRTISPTVVNEFRFGYTQLQNDALTHYAFTRNVTEELGMVGIYNNAPPSWGVPSVALGNGLSGFGDPVDAPFVERNHTFQWLDNLSVVKGNHTMRFGGEIRRERMNEDGNIYNRTNMAFSNGTGTFDPANRLQTGYSFADFQLGLLNQFNWAGDLSRILFRNTSFAVYAEDVWKVTPKLSINAGLRYEQTPPYHDKYRGFENIYYFDPGVGPNGKLTNGRHPVLTRPGKGPFYEGAAARFIDAIPTATGDDLAKLGLPDATIITDKNDFAPRIGLAYSPTARWTVRAGFGVFYAQDVNNASMLAMGENLAGRANVTGNVETANVNLRDPMAPVRGVGSCSGWTGICQGPETRLYTVDALRRTPYIEEWMFNVQRQLSTNVVLELSYLGNEGHKLQIFRNYNLPLLRTSLSDASSLQSRRPWTNLGEIQAVHGVVSSNYHAFSTKLTQRFSKGLTYLAAFTWAKSIDNGSALRPPPGNSGTPLNPYDFHSSRGLSDFNVGRRFVASFIYELPFGRGKHFGANWTAPIDQILGGWQVSSLVTLADGTPRNIGGIGDVTNTSVTSLPDATGISPFLDNPTPQLFWNRAAFDATNPALALRYGNTARNVLFNPGTRTWDFSMIKNTKIREGHALEFRFEAFNFSNHPNWLAPGSDVRVPATFGVINAAKTMREMQLGLKYSF